MITVAAVGIVLGVGIGGWRLKLRSAHYRTLATGFATREKAFATHVKHLEKIAADSERIDKEYAEGMKKRSFFERALLVTGQSAFRAQAINLHKRIAQYQAKADWYATMKSKYQLAASRPWISLSADPPEPQ
jgi:hypothetical protein